MENENRYVVDDNGLINSGYSDLSPYDAQRNKILMELDKYSDKSYNTNEYLRLILFTIFPISGFHRMINGKILSGLLFSLTIGGFFIWLIIDWCLILSGKFTDKEGKPINVIAVSKLQEELNRL